MYANVNVNISDSQKEKLRKALEAGCELFLRLSHSDLVGNNTIALTQSQESLRIWERHNDKNDKKASCT